MKKKTNKRKVIHVNQNQTEYWLRSQYGWKIISRNHALNTWSDYETIKLVHSNESTRGFYGPYLNYFK